MDLKDAMQQLIGESLDDVDKQAELICADPEFALGAKRQLARMFATQVSADVAGMAMQKALQNVLIDIVKEASEEPDAYKKYMPPDPDKLN